MKNSQKNSIIRKEASFFLMDKEYEQILNHNEDTLYTL